LWGFQVLSVFSDKIFLKFLRLGVIFGVVCVLSILLLALMRIFLDILIPGWTGIMVAILMTSIVNLLVLVSGFLMMQAQIQNMNRSNTLGLGEGK